MCRRVFVYTTYTRSNEGVVQPGVVPKEAKNGVKKYKSLDYLGDILVVSTRANLVTAVRYRPSL